MSTSRKRKYGVIKSGAESSAGTNDDVFDKFFSPQPPAPTPQVAPPQQIPPTPEVAPAEQVAPPPESPEPLPERAPPPRVAPTEQVPAGFTMVTHEVSDLILKTLDVYSQSVLQRLLRLSWGHQAETCTVGLPKLAEYCNISINQARRAARMLVSRGLVESLGHDLAASQQELRGTTYRILIQRAPTRQRGATYGGAPTRQVANKEKQLNKDSKSAVCDLCKGMSGHVYVDRDNPKLGVKRCSHPRLGDA